MNISETTPPSFPTNPATAPAPAALVTVNVKNGVVDLWGSITDERQREPVRVLADNVPGVKAVHDHLAWIEPISGTVGNPPADQADSSEP